MPPAVCTCGEDALPDVLGYVRHHDSCPTQNNDPPGCWGCCGAGCRACGSTGFIPVESAIRIIKSRMAKREKDTLGMIAADEVDRRRLAELENMS